ncbi:MAG: hypothetical protein AB1Z98_17555, partial [Nannocystaceae bacterium]
FWPTKPDNWRRGWEIERLIRKRFGIRDYRYWRVKHLRWVLEHGLAAAPGTWWTLVGPVAITLLFVFISLPMIEKRMHARRPGWAAHCRRVSVLVPRPPRGRR